MKRILSMIMAILLLAGCEPETYLFVNESPISFSESGGKTELNIVANKDWKVTSSAVWCNVSPSAGEGESSGSKITIECSANPDYDDRSCLITIVCAELAKSVTITQSQKQALIISQKEYSLDDNGGTITVDIQTNLSYNVEVAEGSSWISEISTKGLSSQSRKFEIKPNTTYDDRTGKIRFYNTASGLNEEVVIKQSCNSAILLTQKEYTLDENGGTITLEIKSNVDFDCEVIEGGLWISEVSTKGLNTSQRYFRINPNDTYDNRVGKIRVYSQTGISETVTVNQKQKAGMEITQKEYEVSSDGGIITVDVKSNVDIKCSIDEGAGWISEISTKGLTAQTRQFSVKANETYDDREGKIRFYSLDGKLKEYVVIKQQAKGELIIEKTQWDVTYESQLLNIAVLTNTNYEVKIGNDCEEWIHNVGTKGLETETISLQISENEKRAREGIVYIVIASEYIALKISQADGTINDYIPDPNFKEYCIIHYDNNNDGMLSHAEAKSVSGIFIDMDSEGAGIVSMEGIEFFTNLRVLHCYGHSGYSEGYGSGNLAKLNVSKNLQLTELYCGCNHLTELDLSQNKELVILGCGYNPLTILKFPKSANLRELDCRGNGLKKLDVSRYTKLESLFCDNNNLTEVDVSNNHELVKLWCSENQLASLDVTKNTALTDLYCYMNQLTTLDVTKNTALTHLSCFDNLLTVLDVSNNTMLTYLECSWNSLTVLDVSNNLSLASLDCDKNQLMTLDVMKNTALTSLSCGYNLLTTLDVSKNSALTKLTCYNETMTDLYLHIGQSFEYQYWYSGTTVHYK